MKMIKKDGSKKGFSLVEMMCVIAIICILGSVMTYSCLQIFHKYKVLLLGEDTPSVSATK